MTPIMITFLALGAAIILETIATSTLYLTEQFTRPLPTIITLLLYGFSFYCLSIALKEIPVGIAYAIWSGLGIVLIATVSWIFFGQKLDLAGIIGLGFILVGVVIVNVFSTAITS